MAIKEYLDFVLVADGVQKDESGLEQFSVEVIASPRGGGVRVEKQKITPDLQKELGRLERRMLDADGVIGLGEKLADLLLPGEIRELFRRCVDTLKSRQGLRLRLRLDPALADIPWEYIYLPREGGARDSTGFLALDPRVSIARHEALQISGDFDDTPRRRRMLAALASPEGEEPLDLDRERENLEEAMSDVPDVDVDFVENATVQALADELVAGADMFHFAGHGVFKRTGLGVTYRTAEGEGAILLVAEDGSAAEVPAEELAVNLRGRGVELVVLGACQTGKRGEGDVWSGVAAALMNAGIPVVVAMQYGIWDDAAIAFHRGFYRGLAAGLPLDYAVSGGRLAAFNRCHPVREDPELGKCWRDWGVPVLYTRAERDFVLPAIRDAAQREAVTSAIDAVAERRRTVIVTGAPDEAQADTLPKRPPRPKWRPWVYSAVGAAVGAALITAAVVTYPIWRDFFREEEDSFPLEKPVPNVVGLMEDDARAKLERSGFEQGRIESARVESDAPEGIVVEQDPGGGSTLAEGGKITLFVSPRPALVKVPEVRGDPEEAARTRLEGPPCNFIINDDDVRKEFSRDIKKGHATRTDPPAGREVPAGSEVILYISRGPPVRVPPVKGDTEKAAREKLERPRYEFIIEDVDEEGSEDVPRGHAIRTDPRAGAEVERGSRITLVVSRGPPVQVPPVEGPAERAAAKLKKMGFDVKIERVPSDEVPSGHVIRTEPPAGTEVERGSSITLVVSTGP